MELYNSLIKDTKAFFDGKNPQRWSYNERDCWTDLGSSELVLQKDAAYELGAMGKGSANYVLFTSNAELVEHDEVELYGPDLKDIKGDCDFARIVLLRVGMLDEDDEIVYRTLKDIEFAKSTRKATWFACPRRATASRFASARPHFARASASSASA